MVFPLRNPRVPLEAHADHLRASAGVNREREQATAGYGLAEPARDGELQRLEESVAWLRREAVSVRSGVALLSQKQPLALPRAAQLSAVSGLLPVSIESSFHRRETSPFRVAPPLASERLQLPPLRRRHRRSLRGAVFILIASTIVGSIAYRVSVGEFFPTSVPAQAASLQAQ
jgi:hypothetical protein